MLMEKIRKLKNKKGFTLVELIVVVAIIAVLAAILVPLMGDYLSQAKVSAANSSASTAKGIMSLFLTESANSSGGGARKPSAGLNVYQVSIQGGVATVANVDITNWVGAYATGTALQAKLQEQFKGVGDGSLAIAVEGTKVLSCLYTEAPGAAAGLNALIDTTAGNPTYGLPVYDATHIDQETQISNEAGTAGMVIGVA